MTSTTLRHAEVAAMFARHGPGYRWWAVTTVMLGTVAAVIEATIVNVALPRILAEFRIGHDSAQLLATGFLAATTVSMLLSFWAIQRFGVRRSFMAALLLLMACSVTAAFARDFPTLAACRIAQGVTAGLIQPLAMLVIVDVFPQGERGRAMSAYGLGIVLAPAAGPAAGGLLVDHFGWPSVFLVTIPLCLAALALAPRYIVRGAAPERSAGYPLDLPGLGLLAGALLLLLGGLAAVLRDPAAAAPTIGGGLALALAFVLWERRAAHPLIDLALLRHPGFGAALAVTTAYGGGLFASAYLIPVFAQNGAGFSAFDAGLMMMPGGLFLALVLMVSGRLADRLAPNRVAMAGLAFFAASSIAFALSPGDAGFWLLAGLVALAHTGLGLVIPGLNAGALRLLPHGAEAAGAAALNFFRQLGGTFGVSLLALFVEARQHAGGRGDAVQGLREGFLLIALAYGLALIPAARMAPPRCARDDTRGGR